MIFVDTNYFLRYLLNDVNKQHLAARQLFEKGALGKVQLCTSTIVIFEIYWVLSSFYQEKKSKIVRVLADILKMRFIRLDQRELLQKSVDIFAANNFDLEDTFNLNFAVGQRVADFKTFDKKLRKKFKEIRELVNYISAPTNSGSFANPPG